MQAQPSISVFVGHEELIALYDTFEPKILQLVHNFRPTLLQEDVVMYVAVLARLVAGVTNPYHGAPSDALELFNKFQSHWAAKITAAHQNPDTSQ